MLAEALSVVELGKDEGKLIKLIEHCSDLNEHFWNLLLDPQPSFELFVTIGFAVKRLKERIKTVWKRLKRSRRQLSQRIVFLYGGYCAAVLQNRNKAVKLRADISIGSYSEDIL